jgi:hypothetical protein
VVAAQVIPLDPYRLVVMEAVEQEIGMIQVVFQVVLKTQEVVAAHLVLVTQEQ